MNTEKPANEYAAMIAVLEAKKAALEAAIANLRFVASGAGAVPPSGVSIDLGTVSASALSSSAPASISGIEDIPNGAFHGKSIPDAARLYLDMIKKKQTTREIGDALLRGGMETTSSKFHTILHGILTRASKTGGGIVRVGKAWGLEGWYHPGLRASQTKPGNGKKQKKTKRAKKSSSPRTQSKTEIKAANFGDLAFYTDAPKNSNDSAGGIQSRLMVFLRKNQGTEYSADQIAHALNVEKKNGVYLVLGKLVAKKELQRTEAGNYLYARESSIN